MRQLAPDAVKAVSTSNFRRDFMKKLQYTLAGGLSLLALAWTLQGNGAKITGLITGTNAFVSAKDLVPGFVSQNHYSGRFA